LEISDNISLTVQLTGIVAMEH